MRGRYADGSVDGSGWSVMRMECGWEWMKWITGWRVAQRDKERQATRGIQQKEGQHRGEIREEGSNRRTQADHHAEGGLVVHNLSWLWQAPLRGVRRMQRSSSSSVVASIETGSGLPCTREDLGIIFPGFRATLTAPCQAQNK
jgi:hypothetical protein